MRVGVIDHSPRLRRGQAGLGHGHDRAQRRVHRKSNRQTFSRNQDQTAVYRSSGLICMSFHLGRNAKHPVGRGLFADGAPGGCCTSNLSRRA